MKKLLYLLLAITIISCGGDDDSGNTNNNSSNLTINPPSWIQGVYYQVFPVTGDVIPYGYEFKADDFCSIAINLATCNKEQLEFYASGTTLFADVYEESDNSRYLLEITFQSTTSAYEFEKVSSTSIKQILPSGDTTYILQ
jgi:hypothetical protein